MGRALNFERIPHPLWLSACHGGQASLPGHPPNGEKRVVSGGRETRFKLFENVLMTHGTTVLYVCNISARLFACFPDASYPPTKAGVEESIPKIRDQAP